MCDHCVMQSVRRRMMSRRDLFKAAPAAAVAATAIAAPATLARAQTSRVVDLTHTVSPSFPTYFGAPGIEMEQKFNFAEHGFNLFNMTLNEHTGTHVDAPLHFSADGQSVDEIPVGNLVCPLAVIHIHEKAETDEEAQVTPDDIKAWTDRHGPIPAGACVAMHSGWETHIGTPKYRSEREGKQHYPGFHVEAAQMLLEDGNAIGLASDTLSLDVGSSGTFDTHYAWLPTNRWGIENIANLAGVPEAGATLILGAPKHEGGSGGPARVLALV